MRPLKRLRYSHRAMSDDETVVTILATVLGIGGWIWRALGLARASRLHPGVGFSVLMSAVAACAVLIFAVLTAAASADVRMAPNYLFMYMALGLAWIWLAEKMFAALGVGARDDAIERRNGAAAAALAGALVGVALCYAGGNIGDGPGWWVVVFSAGLSTLGLFAAWAIHEGLTGISEAVTIDRDPAAGVRLAAFLVEDDVRVREPKWFRRACYAALAMMRFRRSNVGGFGSAVPQQTASRHAGYLG